MKKIAVLLISLLSLFFIPGDVLAVGRVCGCITCGPGYCCNSHLAGTKIKTSAPFALGGYADVLIEILKIGDKLLGYDVILGKYVENIITDFHISIRPDGIYMMKAGDYALSATANHPIYVGQNKLDPKVDAMGYKVAGDLTGKESIFVLAKDKIKDVPLSEVYKVLGEHQVFTLSVSGTNNYFANEILVHNKSCWTNCSTTCSPGWYACNAPGGCCQITCVPNWGPCSQPCGGGTQTDGCGNQRSCNNQSCCTNAAPAAPILSAPASGAQVRVGVASILDWNDVTIWGTACTGVNHHYQICVSGNQTTCNLINNVSTGLTSQYSWTPTLADATVTWHATANNGALSTNSVTRNLCVEGFNSANTAYVSAWRACNPSTHKRTRTCTETCGTDDCTATPVIEDCLGAVRGTMFDASNISSCPGFNPATGYLTGLPAGTGIANANFGFSDQDAVAPHPCAPLTAPKTNGSGNYTESVYAPSNYQYDFSGLGNTYVTNPPKLICTSAIATVPSNPGTCTTQPCSLVNNMSFGFWRIYGGWWQVVGGDVHGEGGITSTIPASLTSEQSLILPDASPANKVVFLSYGVPRSANMLGNNPNAKVSTPLWEKQSSYQGPIYDWSFYDKRFNTFPVTEWSDGQVINYDDQGRGYQIFRTTASVMDFNFSPTGTQKVIFLVDGDVHVTSDITVANGGFLAVIASGSIIFEDTITGAHGWYIGSAINVPCKDVDGTAGCDKIDGQFFGYGTFVGWNAVNLSRDQGALNDNGPSEKFTYRRDLWTNAPDPM